MYAHTHPFYLFGLGFIYKAHAKCELLLKCKIHTLEKISLFATKHYATTCN